MRGFWDHDLEHRGICFAPVILDARIYGRPGWSFRPHFTIGADFLLGSLFVQVGVTNYFFGDYYDPRSTAFGAFTPWVDYRFRNNVYDPLFSYYRWQHRAEPRWEADLRTVYTVRRDNIAVRPPRTLALQARVDAKLRVATPVEQWKGGGFKLEPVTKVHMEKDIHKNTQAWRDLSTQRGKIETAVKHEAPAVKQAEIVKSVKIEMPKTAIVHPTVHIEPPPHPEMPKLLPKPTRPLQGEGGGAGHVRPIPTAAHWCSPVFARTRPAVEASPVRWRTGANFDGSESAPCRRHLRTSVITGSCSRMVMEDRACRANSSHWAAGW